MNLKGCKLNRKQKERAVANTWKSSYQHIDLLKLKNNINSVPTKVWAELKLLERKIRFAIFIERTMKVKHPTLAEWQTQYDGALKLYGLDHLPK